jgi:hypothetical protein
MKSFLVLVILGLSLTAAGFAVVFMAIGGTFPVMSVLVGLAMIFVGLLSFIGGLVVNALRQPTPSELASQDPKNWRTWHLSRAGCLVLAGFYLALLVAVILLQVLQHAFADNAVVIALVAGGTGIGYWLGAWLLHYFMTSPNARARMYRIREQGPGEDAKGPGEATETNHGKVKRSQP